MDLALRSAKYIEEIARHHTGGLLKVAPEHTEPAVLDLMKKPPIEQFETFCKQFQKASSAAGKEQYIVPYFIAGHPGSDLSAMIDLAVYLKHHNLKPEKVQDFIPGPLDIATCMYYTGLDPTTGKPVYVAKGDKERRMQRALLQYFKPEKLCRCPHGLGANSPRRPYRFRAGLFDTGKSAENHECRIIAEESR